MTLAKERAKNYMKLKKNYVEPEGETLAEAAKSNYNNKTARIPVPTSHWFNSEFLQIQNFIEGAKSDAARNYWFEQFKKK